MKKSIQLPILLIIVCLSQFIEAQSENIDDGISSSKWEFYGQAGLGVSNELKDDGEWHVPRAGTSLDFGFSRRVNKFFWITSGVGFDFYTFKSEPFRLYFVGPGYSHTGSGIVPHTKYDDRESEIQRRRGYISIPLLAEFHGTSRWAPYFKLGALFSLNVYDMNRTHYVTGGPASTMNSTSNDKIGNYSSPTLLGSAGAGIHFQKGETSFTFGVAMNVGLYALGNSEYPGALPNVLLLEIGFRRDIFNKSKK